MMYRYIDIAIDIDIDIVSARYVCHISLCYLQVTFLDHFRAKRLSSSEVPFTRVKYRCVLSPGPHPKQDV